MRYVLISLIVSLILLSGCKKDNNIIRQLNPDGTVNLFQEAGIIALDNYTVRDIESGEKMPPYIMVYKKIE